MRGEDPVDRAARLREEAAQLDTRAEALEGLREELANEPVPETRLAGLFEEAAGSDPRIWNTVTAFIDVEDGEAVVTDESKLAAGKWAPEIVEGCDAMITVEIGTGWTHERFVEVTRGKLAERIAEARERAHDRRAEADELVDEG